MKKRNFLHRVVGWIERELEATLAILVILAGVVGYSLAATDTTTETNNSPITAQQVNVLMYKGQAYSSLVFAQSLAGTDAVYVRAVTLDADAPSDIITSRTEGLQGASSGVTYKASVALTQAYSGPLYVWGKFSQVTLNGQSVANSTTPVYITGSDKLTLTFPGAISSITGLSTSPKTTKTVESVASIYLVPSAITIPVGETRQFVTLVTNADGKSISTPVSWTMSTTPTGIATINQSTGAITAKSAGVVKVTATASGKTASATITIVAETQAETSPVIAYPGADEGTTPKTTAPKTEDATNQPQNSWNTDWGSDAAKVTPESESSLLNKLAEILAPASQAATNETAVPAATAVSEALFSPAMVASRVENTGSINPTQAEVRAATRNMTLTQKVVTNFQIAKNQIAQDLRAIVLGTKVVDEAGKVIVEKPSALKAIGNFLGNLITGGRKDAGAAPTKVEIGNDGDDTN